MLHKSEFKTPEQVVTPMRKGGAGTAELNLRLQHLLNPPAPTKCEWKVNASTVCITSHIHYHYGYRTDNKKPPVTNRFLNLSVILDLSPGVSILSNSSRC